MRLQQPIFASKPLASIKLRIVATDVPDSAAVRITDVQLQAGEQATGVVPNPVEVATTRNRAQYRNGVVNPGMDVVALSNGDKAAPVRMRVLDAQGQTRIGSYRFGRLNGSATADSGAHAATAGWGRAPIITERQDLALETEIENRLHLRLMWNERT
ncbi:hypothetical protein [Glutamicibacter sp. X7]